MEILNNIYVTEILKWLILISAGMILQQLRKILKRLTLVEYKLQAADYALEKSFKNGYEIHRDAKLRELLKSDSFINK
ncbi:MAG: hypothetical protein UZ05_CHB002002504 [Chlorobi bacterium OLB5]|nr:MAG: hypothetical protein UZ05_CHB002002504 [Chlorobi bacterium OLB5]